MPEPEASKPSDHYLQLLFEHHWLIIIPFLLCLVIGIVLAIMLPREYKASAIILERPQGGSTDYVPDIDVKNVDARIVTLSQKIRSNSNLEKIINQFNLYMAPDQEDMYLEKKIADLRKHIRISYQELDTDRRMLENAFSISYIGSEPEVVARVANSLAVLFIEENLKVREGQAEGTRSFIEEELQEMRNKLENHEDKIKEYRKIHMGELPEQLGTNLRTIDRLVAQLNAKQEQLRNATDRLAILANQIEFENNIVVPVGEFGEGLTLPQLKQKLVDLQTSYTDRHPSVIRLKAKVDELEAKIASGEYEDTPPTLTSASSPEELRRARIYSTYRTQQAELNSKIKNLKIEISEINNEIKKYEIRVDNAPILEQELMTLKRDYNNLQESYSRLLNRKLEADISVNMEKKHGIDQFQIIERARVPRDPTFPNLKILFLASVFIGINIGAGIIFLIDFFDTSIKRPEDIERTIGIKTLVTVPKIHHAKDRIFKKVNTIMTGVSILFSFCLLAAFAFLVFNGVEPTIELLREHDLLQRIGVYVL